MSRPPLLREDQAHWTGVVYDAEFWGIDQRCYWALSEQGGSYNLVDTLVLDGAGIWIQCVMTVSNGGSVKIDTMGSLGVYSTALFHETSETTFEYGSAVSLAGDLTVESTGTISLESGATLGLALRGAATCTPYTRTVILNALVACGLYDFTQYDTADWTYWLQSTAPDDPPAHIDICLNAVVPLVAAITEIVVEVQGAGAHAGLPSVMPKVQILRQDVDDSGHTLMYTATDDSASVAAYQSTHTITLDGLNLSPVNYAWTLRITGEGGTNKLVGLNVYTASITWSTNSIGL